MSDMPESAGSSPSPALVPARTAIVLIDLQNDVVRGSGPFYEQLAEQVRQRKVIENAVRLVDGARATGAKIFFVKVVRRPDYAEVVDQLTELVVRGKAGPAKKQVSLVEGTPGARLVDELQPQPEDYVLVKKRRSAFYSTELDFHLRTLGIDTVAIGGVATDLGVENTVRDGWDRDYNLIVVSDISAAYPPTAHDYAINSVFPRMARIMTTDQILDQLQQGGAA